MQRNIPLSLLLLLVGTVAALAQSEPAKKVKTAPPVPPVTISLTAAGVRFAAPNSVGQMRVEVFDAAGQSLYDSGFQPGTVRDWAVQDKQGQALADGAYQCVVTLRDLAGRLNLRQGGISVQGGRTALQLSEGAPAAQLEADDALAPVADDATTAATLTAHDGRNGRLVTTKGALSFRVGDFFAGLDKEQMRLTEAGNLGLGTAKPQAKLDVAGDIRAAGFLRTTQGIEFADGTVQTTGLSGHTDAAGNIVPLAAGTGTQNFVAKWTETGGSGTLGNSLLFDNGTNVGIGTNNPLKRLHVSGGTIALDNIRFLYARRTNGNFQEAFGIDNNDDIVFNRNAIVAGVDADAPQASSALIFGTGAGRFMDVRNAQNVPLFRIFEATGNVGIGTPTPQARLDVAGDVQVGGNFNATGTVTGGNIVAKYQDVAEWVPARGAVPAGTVVVLDTSRRNGVIASWRAYDTHVAGVVSAQPGMILGQGGAGQALVATTGRVKVKVDARRGAIHIGDLLVTSEQPGVAMRSQPVRAGSVRLHRPGTIIGKALEPLDHGTGEILVLLSLQ